LQPDSKYKAFILPAQEQQRIPLLMLRRA